MTRDELFREACLRYALALDAVARGNMPEARVQSLAHQACGAALWGYLIGEAAAQP